MAKRMNPAKGEATGVDGKPVETTEDGKRVLQNVQARQACIQEGFEKRLKLERDIEALTEKHLKPVKDELKKLRKNMSADTGVDATDLNLQYALYKRQEEAKLMDEDDKDRILDNMREVFGYLQKGEMLDFIPVLEAA